MLPVEAWQKELISSDFKSSAHGRIACTACHGGSEGVSTMAQAHAGMRRDPEAQVCEQCHKGIGESQSHSLHATLAGYTNMIRDRSGQGTLHPQLEAMFNKHCATCHATCGQCHVSRPHSVGGGFIEGHAFRKRPSMTENCTACHGSRVGEEFRGEHAGLAADTHYNRGMQCVACHQNEELHASAAGAQNRYQAASAPKCVDCHNVTNSNTYHAAHGNKVSCQVCHSQPYKNCYNCHVGTETKGLQLPSEMDFKIGRNPLKSAERPENYVLVRHIPIAPDAYDDWLPGALQNFAVMPTWKSTTPHNIQKRTPQTADCTSSCHNNRDLFLTEDDLQGASAQEAAANQNVIVQAIPH